MVMNKGTSNDLEIPVDTFRIFEILIAVGNITEEENYI